MEAILELQRTAGNTAVSALITGEPHVQREGYAPGESPIAASPPDKVTAVVVSQNVGRDSMPVVVVDRPLTMGQAMRFIWPTTTPQDSKVLRPDPPDRRDPQGWQKFRVDVTRLDAAAQTALIESMRPELREPVRARVRFQSHLRQEHRRQDSLLARIGELSARVAGEGEAGGGD